MIHINLKHNNLNIVEIQARIFLYWLQRFNTTVARYGVTAAQADRAFKSLAVSIKKHNLISCLHTAEVLKNDKNTL